MFQFLGRGSDPLFHMPQILVCLFELIQFRGKRIALRLRRSDCLGQAPDLSPYLRARTAFQKEEPAETPSCDSQNYR